MKRTHQNRACMFRVWLTTYQDWRPTHWAQVPPRAKVIEPAERGCFNAADAAAFVEGFNTRMLNRREPLWAIAVPVVVCYEGDLSAGKSLAPRRVAAAWEEVEQDSIHAHV